MPQAKDQAPTLWQDDHKLPWAAMFEVTFPVGGALDAKKGSGDTADDLLMMTAVVVLLFYGAVRTVLFFAQH